MSIGTMVWTVTFRMDAKSAQQELPRYTKEAADAFAQGILDLGGVAIVTEDYEEDSELPSAGGNEDTLDWSK
jgi:hypothetical protein